MLECVGIPTLNSSLRCLKPLGRVVIVGNVTPGLARVNPGLLIMKEISILGSSGASRDDLATVLDLAAAGVLKPVLADVLPLHQAVHAQAICERGESMGRIVLDPSLRAKL